MKIIKHRSSIVVTLEFLKKIETCLKRKLDISDYSVDYKCRFKKFAPQQFSTADDLVDCDNSLDRRIETLTIHVESSTEKEIYFELIIGRQEQGEYNFLDLYTVYGSVQGESSYMETIYNELKYQIRRGSRPPLYTFLSRAGFVFTIGLMVFLSGVYIHYFGLPQEYVDPLRGVKVPYDTLSAWYRINQYKMACTVPCAVALFLRGIFKRMCPRTLFLFGDGEDALVRKAELKSRFIWDVIIAILVGAAGALVYEMLNIVLCKLLA